MSKLEVEISGDVKKLKTAINDATGQLKGLGNQGAKTSKKVSSNFKVAGRSAGQAGIQIQQFVGQLQGGQNPLVAFSQQSADLGFVLGVPLAGAIASIAASLAGFLVPSLIKSTTAAKELTNAFKEISTKSIVEFTTLTDIVLDTNSSFEEQRRAIILLRKKYKDFDASILENKKNYDLARQSIDNYINKLTEQAKAQAALELIQEKQSKILILEEKRLLKIRSSYGAATIEQFEKRRKKLIQVAKKQAGDLSKLDEKRRKVREAQLAKLISNINKRFDNIKSIGRKEIQELQYQIKVLSQLANVRSKVLAEFKGGGFEVPEIVVPITIGQPSGLTRVDTGVSVAALQAQIKALKDQQTQVSKTSEQWQEYSLKIKQVQKQLEIITKGDAKSLLGNTIAGQIAADIEAINIQRLKEKMQEIQFSANMLSQSIQQSFANVTNSISQNLQNSLGFLGSFLGELLNFFTQVIQARIRQQVQEMALAKKQQIINAVTAKSQLASDKVRAASSAAVAASNTAKAAGPKGAFLLPVLIAGALGAVSSAFSKIGGSGGSMGTGSVAGAGSSSGFSSGTTFGGARPFSGNLTFTIRGTDLVAVLNSANSQNAIIGGNVSVG